MTTEQDILEQRLATAQYEQETAELARRLLTEIALKNLKAAEIRLIQAESDGHPLPTRHFPKGTVR